MIPINKTMKWKDCQAKYPDMWMKHKPDSLVYAPNGDLDSLFVIAALTPEEGYHLVEATEHFKYAIIATTWMEGAINE